MWKRKVLPPFFSPHVGTEKVEEKEAVTHKNGWRAREEEEEERRKGERWFFRRHID